MNTSEHIHNCISTLKNNETILFPTDTVLGLGCDANSDTAVEKIINLKDRNDKQGFIVLVSSIEELHKYVKDVPIEAKSLIEETDKPLSIIYPKGKNVSKKVLAENGSIAIRIVKSGFAHELLSNYQKAIIATSVNLSGEPPAISLG
ncbi:MAG: translation factor Sua5, partial [Bacteroidia bacterium]|nr:Sua5/YciO/YrdC/YwlC family protein [Bacteroidia bacterium]NNM16412.1 translation factor Sua5 [Bacteroidia bacterium]